MPATMTPWIDPEVRRSAFAARAISEPVRLQMMLTLAASEHAVGELARAIGAIQQQVSHHLCMLRLRGLVGYERNGKSNVYHLTDAGRDALRRTGLVGHSLAG